MGNDSFVRIIMATLAPTSAKRKKPDLPKSVATSKEQNDSGIRPLKKAKLTLIDLTGDSDGEKENNSAKKGIGSSRGPDVMTVLFRLRVRDFTDIMCLLMADTTPRSASPHWSVRSAKRTKS